MRAHRRPPPGGFGGFAPGGAKSPAKGALSGFGTPSTSGLGYVAEKQDLSAVADAQVVVAFKSLVKKDGTTKSRALDELLEYARARGGEGDGAGGGEGGSTAKATTTTTTTTAPPDDAVLDAWAQCYGRLSIDDARLVREGAHAVQAALAQAARRGMERRLGRVAGPWVAGTFDRDRGVARAAADGLAALLPTAERAHRFWTRLRAPLLAYAAAALCETPATLSDLRATTADDAALKHARVLCGSLALVGALVGGGRVADKGDETDGKDRKIDQQADADSDFAPFFRVDALWTTCALSADPSVRRSTYDLLQRCLDARPILLRPHVERLTRLLTRDALAVSQAGSIIEYVRLLRRLTEQFPEIWSSADDRDRLDPYTTLRPLLKKASQGAPPPTVVTFWEEVGVLYAAVFAALPSDAPPPGIDTATALLAAVRAGITRPDERRANAGSAWNTYLTMARHLIDRVAPDARIALVEAAVFPLLRQFVAGRPIGRQTDAAAVVAASDAASDASNTPTPDPSFFTGDHVDTVARATLLVGRPVHADVVAAARAEWTRLGVAMAVRVAGALPAVSPAFEASQRAVAHEAIGWVGIVDRLHQMTGGKAPPESLAVMQMPGEGTPSTLNLAQDLVAAPTLALVETAADLLVTRRFQPHGIAAFVAHVFAHAPYTLLRDDDTVTRTRAVVDKLFGHVSPASSSSPALDLMLASSSAVPLLDCVCALADLAPLRTQYEAVHAALLAKLVADGSVTAVRNSLTAQQVARLLTGASDAVLATARRNVDLQRYLGAVGLSTARGTIEAWDLLRVMLATHTLGAAAGNALVSGIVEAMGEGGVEASDDTDSADSADATTAATASPVALLTALETVADRAPELLSPRDEDARNVLHHALVARLLGLTERGDMALAAKALAVRTLIDGKRTAGGRGDGTDGIEKTPPVLRIIHDHLDRADSDVLAVETLAEQATQLASSMTTPDERERLLPHAAVWMQALQACMQPGAVRASQSLTSGLRGAYLLVAGEDEGPRRGVVEAALPRDRNGLTVAARMAAYATRLMAVDGFSVAMLPSAQQVSLLHCLALVAELGADQVVMGSTQSLWGDLGGKNEEEEEEEDDDVAWARSTAEEQVADIQAVVADVLRTLNAATVEALITALLDQTRETRPGKTQKMQKVQQPTPLALYAARALNTLLQTRLAAAGFSAADEAALAQRELWKGSTGATGVTGTTLGSVAFLTGYGELLAASPSVSHLCNRLVSDVAGASPDAPATLPTLVLLNACLGVYDVGAVPAATNRLMFAVRQITTWMAGGGRGDDVCDDDDNDEGDDDNGDNDNGRRPLPPILAAESCRALQRLLPCIKDMYGAHWERTLAFCIRQLDSAAKDNGNDSDKRLPVIHAALKLLALLDGLGACNDDLVDARVLLADAKWASVRRLLLARSRRATTTTTRPQALVDTLLARTAGGMPMVMPAGVDTDVVADADDGLSDLYALVTSASRDIQAAGFGLLHRALPARQGELSVASILEKKDARLPAPLMTLLQDAPTPDSLPDPLTTFPHRLRRYLLAWLLVYDAVGAASVKVRADYAAHLAEAAAVPALLDLVVAVLGHTAGRPLALDRAGLAGREHIAVFDYAGTADADGETDTRHLQHLLVHLYYRTLQHVPGLFRAWFAACRSKQTTVAVEAWTARFVSGLLVDEALDEVAASAAETARSGDGEQELAVKVSKRTREVVAGYDVDDQTMSIALRLPTNYPIDKVDVVGLRRVAVDERRWQSWLLSTQGVIAFSGGAAGSSLVDGLATFRRNVLGALRGQSECAICYSIIAADKSMPDKRCTTCKNLFHRACLYKWFQTSSQNSCPLCRNPISFLGADKRRRGED